MLLEEAIRIHEVEVALDNIEHWNQDSADAVLPAFYAKARRISRRGRTIYASSGKEIWIDTYSGPSKKRSVRTCIKINRRSTLYYAEVKGKTDWEPS